ncbi:MAG TPA: DUF5660 family protein [Patescibacteria group bacterium]|nr:DUF5660 family protein [Patescibacteria group bacterium]
MGKTGTQVQRSQGFEALREIGDTITEAAKNETKQGWKDFWAQMGVQLNGATQSPEANHTNPDKPLVLKDPFTGAVEVFKAANKPSAERQQKEQAPQRAEAAIDHHTDFIKSSERAAQMERSEITKRLNDIMAELQRLVSSSKVLQMEFADVSVQQAPQQAGEYHLNFFDWLLLTIRAARQKVEDSGAWLATSKKKGKKGKGTWNNKQRKDWFENTSLSMGNESGGGYINQTG